VNLYPPESHKRFSSCYSLQSAGIGFPLHSIYYADEDLIEQVAKVLKSPVEEIKNFDEEVL